MDARTASARATCAKIRNIMSVLYPHARQYDLFENNPIAFVRQSAKRRSIPHILTIDEIQRLLSELGPRHYAMILIDVLTGLRRSELFAPKWPDEISRKVVRRALTKLGINKRLR